MASLASSQRRALCSWCRWLPAPDHPPGASFSGTIRRQDTVGGPRHHRILAIFTLLFTAIYKILPDTAIPRPDLVLGAFVTAVLFTVGKSLIGINLGRAASSSPNGAAGALIVLMFWTYYSAQTFLFGAYKNHR